MMLRTTVFFAVCALLAISAHGQRRGDQYGNMRQRPMGGGRFEGGRPDGGRFGGRPDGGRPEGRPDGGRFGGRPEGRPDGGRPEGRPDGGRLGGRPEGRPNGGRFGGRPEGRPDGGRPEGRRFDARLEGRPDGGRPDGSPPRFGEPLFGQGGRDMDTDSKDGRQGPPFNFDELDHRHHGHHHQHHHHRHHHNGTHQHNGTHNHTEHGQGQEENWDRDFHFRRNGSFGRPPFWRRNGSDGEVPDRRGPHHHAQHHHGHEHHHHGHRRHNRTTDGEEMPDGRPFRFGLGGPGRDNMEGRRPFWRPGGPGPRGFRGPHRPHGPHVNRGGFPFGGRGEGRGDRYDGEKPEVEIPTTEATPEPEIVGIEDNGLDTDIANELN